MYRTVNSNNNYQVSSLGEVLNTKTGRILRKSKDRKGYDYVELWKNNERTKASVHRLVAIAFLGHEKGKVVNHINNIHDDNRLENLEWLSQGDNTRHYYDNHYERMGPRCYTENRIKGLYNSRDWASAEEFFKALIPSKL